MFHLFSVALALSLSLLDLTVGVDAVSVVGPVGQLNIVNEVIQPDGFPRSAVLVDGTFPGPLIRGNKGDRFTLDVQDSLVDNTMLRSTTIHWHGIHQYNTNWADGVAFVTQCPIATNHSFLYDFTVKEQAGTFWYHSHLSTQYCDGLRGPFIVYDPNDHYKSWYDFDDESTVLTLADWYHTPAPSAGPAPLSDATLFNGKGRYAGDPTADLEVINVQPGKRYRFRLISISCDSNFIFSIDSHNMTVIEADAEPTEPWTVNTLQIFAGQRYSIIVTANQPVDNYWIRANPDRGATSGFTNGTNSAIFRYAGAPEVDPTSSQPTDVVLLQETDLHPLTNPRAPGKPYPGGADISFRFAFDFNFTSFEFTTNGSSFLPPPTVPVLLQILSGAQSAQDLLPPGVVYTLEPNKVVEVVMPAGVIGGPHPFHLHGHSFSVVRSAGNSSYNWDNPVRRDVVSIGDTGDEVTIRFVTDNAGPWFLHCHIDWHLDLGLAIVFAEDPSHTQDRVPIPPAWNDLCPIYDALTPDQLFVNVTTS